MKNKSILQFLFILLLGILVYYFFLRQIGIELYCKKQVNFKLYKFRQSVKKNGADKNTEENNNVENFLNQMYASCIKKQ